MNTEANKRPVSRRSLLLAATVGVPTALLMTGCGNDEKTDTKPASSDNPQPLTDEQAAMLAQMRFNNFDAGVREFAGEVIGAQDTMRMVGWVDYSNKRGYANVSQTRVNSTEGQPIPAFLANWNPGRVDFLENPPVSGPSALPPFPRPEGAWSGGALGENAISRAMVALLLLGADRPENPLLIKQSAARYLGTEGDGERKLSIFTGFSPDDVTSASATASATARAKGDDRTKYGINDKGLLIQFGIRLDQVRPLSDFSFKTSSENAPKELPEPSAS